MTYGDTIVVIDSSPTSSVTSSSQSDKKFPAIIRTTAVAEEKEQTPSNYESKLLEFDNHHAVASTQRSETRKARHASSPATSRLRIFKRCLYLCSVVLVALAVPTAILGTIKRSVSAGGVRLFGVFVYIIASWSFFWASVIVVKCCVWLLHFFTRDVTAGAIGFLRLAKGLEMCIYFFVWCILSYCTVGIIQHVNFANDAVLSASLNPTDWIAMLRRGLLITVPVIALFAVEKVCIQGIVAGYRRVQFREQIVTVHDKVKALETLFRAVHKWPLDAEMSEELQDEYTDINSPLKRTETGHWHSAPTQAKKGRYAEHGHHVHISLAGIGHEVASSLGLDDHVVTVHSALAKYDACKSLGRIVWSTIGGGRRDFTFEDVHRVLRADRINQGVDLTGLIEEAKHIFDSIDLDGNGNVRQSEMQDMVLGLSEQLHLLKKNKIGIENIINQLDWILMSITAISSCIIYACFFSSYFVSHLTTFMSTVMAGSFAFSSSVAELTGSCIFVLIKHPYDIGDKVEINSIQLQVAAISLLYTKFYQIDTGCMVQIPNSVNNANWINNISRSRVMKERIKIEVDASTTSDKIDRLQSELEAFVKLPENCREYYETVLVHVNTVKDLQSLELQIEFRHKSIWAKERVRLQRRAKFLTHMIGVASRMPILIPGAATAAAATS